MATADKSRLNEDERGLIIRLRDEASYLKDCFTKFSIQSMGLSIFGIGAIVELQSNNDYLPFASILFVALILTVVRIGTHKYESANRVLGFELYLWRRLRLRESENGWKKSMRSIGWEEALYAWRIIQPTVYNSLYRKYLIVRKTRKRKKYERAEKWIDPNSFHTIGKVKYEAGSYMRLMFLVLHFFSIAALAPLALKSIELYVKAGNLHIAIGDCLFITYIVILVISFTYIIIRIKRIGRKRIILESELLSVNACAILWNAVVIAHFRALKAVGANENTWDLDRYQFYTKNLLIQASEIRKNTHRIYEWIDGKEVSTNKTNVHL